MLEIKNQILTGERALFQGQNLQIVNCTFRDGESPLKESRNIFAENTTFSWKYPLWYARNIEIEFSTFAISARSGIWYTDHVSISNSTIDAPKIFRYSRNIDLSNCTLTNAAETLWNCRNIRGKKLTIKGDYFGLNSVDVVLQNITHTGNYIFDGGQNITVKESTILSKDAFWNCDNVTLIDCTIIGEYFGWNSKNITLINCTVESMQGFCYMENLVMKNCILRNTFLAFEYSTIDIDINSTIDSVKNPSGGRIKAPHISELILEESKIDPQKTEIIVTE